MLVSVAQGREHSQPPHLQSIRKASGNTCVATEVAESNTSWVEWIGPLHPEVRSWDSRGKHRPEAYDLLGRQCQETTPVWHSVRQGVDSVTFTISSSWALSASQDVSIWKNNFWQFSSLVRPTRIPVPYFLWTLSNETDLAYVYFIIVLSSYISCSKCVLDILCNCLQVLKGAFVS